MSKKYQTLTLRLMLLIYQTKGIGEKQLFGGGRGWGETIYA